MTSLTNRALAFVDLETSGATVREDRITEIGIITVDPDGTVEEWSTLVNPGQRIPSMIEMLTGISNAMVELAPTFDQVAGEVYRRLQDRLFIAHNVRFDYGFLKAEFGMLGVTFRPKLLCTARLSRALFPQHRHHNLDSLIERHGLECSARHRALPDAQVMWQFIRCVKTECPPEALAAAIAKQLHTPSLPPGLDPAVLEDIPDSHGVYIFYGDEGVAGGAGAPLYVGKSVNLRTRVMSHFSGDHASPRDATLSQQLKRVEWIKTAGELGALLTEARLIKELMPAHNRLLRKNDEPCTLSWVPSMVSGKPPRIVRAAEIEPANLAESFGLFRTRKKATEALAAIAETHQFCPRLLGLEKGSMADFPRPCFAHQVKKCKGACCGQETLAAHNLRLLTALMRLRLKPWPYKGLTGFREVKPGEPAGDAFTELHLFDQWCYFGSVQSEEELRERMTSRAQPQFAQFDLDIYKILSRHLEKHSKSVDVVPLGQSMARQLRLELNPA